MKYKITLSIIVILSILVSCSPEDGTNVTITEPGDSGNTEDSISTDNNTLDGGDGSENETLEPDDEIDEEDEPEEEESYVSAEGLEIIEIEDLKFKPRTITIDKGTTIKWIHNDKYSGVENIKHLLSIYKTSGVFNVQSGQLFFGDSFNYTFDEPGEYYYIDIVFKDKMRGEITVE